MSKLQILTDAEPTLEFLQSAVGGYIEIINVDDGQLIVNEEGMIRGLEHNHDASMVAGHPVVGDAVLLKEEAQLQ